MTDIKAGDEVRVFDVNGRRMGQPEGGWTGLVTKVGRTLVTIEYGSRQKQFRLDTGQSNDSYAHQSFLTTEQATWRVRRAAAVQVLTSHEIYLSHGSRLTVGQIEALAEVAKTFGQEG